MGDGWRGMGLQMGHRMVEMGGLQVADVESGGASNG